jgi:hypothetical protein
MRHCEQEDGQGKRSPNSTTDGSCHATRNYPPPDHPRQRWSLVQAPCRTWGSHRDGPAQLPDAWDRCRWFSRWASTPDFVPTPGRISDSRPVDPLRRQDTSGKNTLQQPMASLRHEHDRGAYECARRPVTLRHSRSVLLHRARVRGCRGRCIRLCHCNNRQSFWLGHFATETSSGSVHCKSQTSDHHVRRGAPSLRPRSFHKLDLWSSVYLSVAPGSEMGHFNNLHSLRQT